MDQITYCHTCGGEVPVDALLCPHCGLPMKSEHAPSRARLPGWAWVGVVVGTVAGLLALLL